MILPERLYHLLGLASHRPDQTNISMVVSISMASPPLFRKVVCTWFSGNLGAFFFFSGFPVCLKIIFVPASYRHNNGHHHHHNHQISPASPSISE